MMPASHVLDQPARSALAGADRRFAVGPASAPRYRVEVSSFATFDRVEDLVGLESLVPAEHSVAIFDAGHLPGWTTVHTVRVLQMTGVDAASAATADEAILDLGEADAADMVALATLTRPGPFFDRTFELGGYVGIRHEGQLVAMAGERMHPDGWAEVSAVCTRPEYRGRGFAARLLLTVADRARDRGISPFLHVAVVNDGAMRLYRQLGFVDRRELTIDVVHPTTS